MCTPTAVEIALAGLSRRELLNLSAGLFGGVVLGSTLATTAAEPLSPTVRLGQVLDLTHPLSPTFPIWPGPQNKPIRLSQLSAVAQSGFYANRWEVNEHHGTHLDTPSHVVDAGMTAEQIPAASLIAPLVVLNIRDRARKNVDAEVLPDDVLQWEKRHGKIPAGAAVMMDSGWDAYAGDAQRFTGMDATQTLHFPGFAPKTCEMLVQERHIVGVGVDTLSFDIGPSKDFRSHRVILGARKWILECVANLSKAPPSGAWVFVGLPKVVAASGGPTRVLAVWG